jgi:hypothetical protein
MQVPRTEARRWGIQLVPEQGAGGNQTDVIQAGGGALKLWDVIALVQQSAPIVGCGAPNQFPTRQDPWEAQRPNHKESFAEISLNRMVQRIHSPQCDLGPQSEN